jgi:hypothetical protein
MEATAPIDDMSIRPTKTRATICCRFIPGSVSPVT